MLNYLDVFLFVWNGPGSEKVFYNAPAGFLFYVSERVLLSIFFSLLFRFCFQLCLRQSRTMSCVGHWDNASSWLLSLFLIFILIVYALISSYAVQ